MMLEEIIKAFSIGVCASVPLGPIAILVIQKSLCYGHRAGFVTGLGATTVDTTYAAVSVFALALAKSFIDKYNSVIYLAGGIIVALLGASMAFKDPFTGISKESQRSNASIKDYFQAVATALSNPGAIFVMLALFAFFNLDIHGEGARVLPVILSVAAGSASYWMLFSWLFSKWRKNLRTRSLMWMNRIAGLILLIVGIAVFADGLFQAVFHGGLKLNM